MSSITIKFEGFWTTFDVEDNNFVNAMRSRHDVRVIPTHSNEKPDILFYSRCGNRTEHLDYDCIKIYFTGENDCPDFNQCDYALSFYPLTLGDRHLRYPLYMLYEYNQLGEREISDSDALGRGFCSLVMRNANNCDPKRLQLIDLVDSYRGLAYGGSFRNNVGGCIPDKIDFIANYKFNLALENSNFPGYVTEKILEPLVARTVPIYWGSEYVKTDFNPEAFINVDDYRSNDSFLQALKEIDNKADIYLKYLSAPPLRSDINIDFNAQLADFLDNIVMHRTRYIAPYGEVKILQDRAQITSRIAKHPYLLKLCDKLL